VSARYLVRKLIGAFFTILAIVILNFLLFRAMPGSPERVLMRNPNVSAEAKAAARARWGLDKSLPEQLVAYIQATATGDMGYSIKFRGKPVVDVIGVRVWPTVLLVGVGELIAIVVGLALGAYAGWRRGSALDRVGNGAGLVLYSMPYFVIGMPMIIIFAATLHWFPTSGMSQAGAQFSSPIDATIDLLRHLALPLATVALGLIGGYSILMRSSIIDTRSEDYVTTARAKGLPDGRILRSHAFPNALLPMVTYIAISLGYVIAGAITAEVVFNWPGIGTLTVDALSSRDYPLLQGIFLLLAVSVVLANLAADIVYGFLDPRVRS
jgi:peptide/nickel transport system permease protein